MGAVFNLLLIRELAFKLGVEGFAEYALNLAYVGVVFQILITPVIQLSKASLNDNNAKLSLNLGLLVIGLAFISGVMVPLIFNVQSIIIFYLLFESCYQISWSALQVQGKRLIFIIGHAGLSILSFLLIFIFKPNNLHDVFILIAVPRAIISLLYLIKIKVKKKNYYLFKSYKKYTFQIALSNIGIALNNHADKFVFEQNSNLTDLGNYSAAHSIIGKPFNIITGAFVSYNNSCIYKINDSNYFLRIRRIRKLFLLTIFISSLLVYSMSELILKLILPDKFLINKTLILLLIIGFFFQSMSQLFEAEFYARKKSSQLLIITIVGGVFNLFLNIVLIPHYGAIGAGISMSIGFFIQCALAGIIIRKK
ncbi:polysaccharide biosynthesis C-terminal domain-containing protein [Verrucomicrobiales bacterium]|nr:polysaccharide biosynthesis C-terminal domain-containing protein [Verrucomicrobiales bacterium]